jgi:hypothetical protein
MPGSSTTHRPQQRCSMWRPWFSCAMQLPASSRTGPTISRGCASWPLSGRWWPQATTRRWPNPPSSAFFAGVSRSCCSATRCLRWRGLPLVTPLIGLTNGNADWHSIGLSPYFNRGVLAAREFGQGKPHAAFFHEACKRLDLPPAQVLHGGDDWHLDVEGALDAGLQAVWLRHTELPPAKFSAPRRVAQADSLLALCDLLGC